MSRSRSPRKPAARKARSRSASSSSASHAGAPSHASSSARRKVGRIVGAGPDVRRNLGAPAARRAVEHRRDRAVPHQHLAGCRLRGPGRRRRGRANDLAVRLVAEIEAVGAMPIAIAERKGADGDGQHLERGRPGFRAPPRRRARGRCRFRAAASGSCSRRRAGQSRCAARSAGAAARCAGRTARPGSTGSPAATRTI